ncbi:MAG: hypothetical protein FJ224_04375 [Lentisphaerae bacterium]|nr:hypothetical protein [Lentisphaerota bacterium]
MSYPKPDIVGVWLFKWVVGPLLALGLIVWLVNLEVMKYKCRKMAEDRGYIEATYIPPNGAGFGEQCICWKKRNPDGTIDEKAKIVINLD